jgi:glycosyltransferase involved in cell wall biosynthesis
MDIRAGTTRSGVWRVARGWVARLADAVVFYGDRDARRFVSLTGRRTSVFVARNAVDQRPIQAERNALAAAPAVLDESAQDNDLVGRPMVLHVSRYKAENRVDLLLEAAARLRSRHPRLAVVIIGDGTDESPDLRELIERHGLQDVVRLLGPLYQEAELAKWFLSADIFCYPSNLGLSVLHAFGYGLPVVAGDIWDANPPEWQAIEDDRNGRFYEAGNVESLAATLDELLSDAGTRRRLGEAAHRTAVEDYTIEAMLAGLVTAIDYCTEL